MTNDKDSAVLAKRVERVTKWLDGGCSTWGTPMQDIREILNALRQPTQSDALREALGSVIALLDTQAEPPKSVVSVQDYARWANARIGLGLVMIAPRLRAALQEQSK